ncbi:MAG: hypothetical protein ACUVRZ_00815 [Desulfobacca sp.]|uniref:hypothetical protein n=1 Tax=Desulfobacca sp. TaxID=2067990 RepID=UPI00404AA4ED
MAVTEIRGKKFIQVDLGASGGDYAMSQAAIIREVRLTNIAPEDYMVFYEAAESEPKIFRLDHDRSATFFQGRLMTKIGFRWADCSVASPATAILSIEME